MPADNFTARKLAWLEQVAGDGGLPHRAVRVAVVLASYLSREHGCAWPSSDTIARRAGLWRSAAQHALQSLVDHEHLERESGGGRGRSTRYWPRLHPEKQPHTMGGFSAKQPHSVGGFDSKTDHTTTQKQPHSVGTTPMRETTEGVSLTEEPRDLFSTNGLDRTESKASNSPAGEGKKDSLAESFREFYRHYPKKADPKAAERAFRKAVKEGASPADLIAGAMRYAAEREGKKSRYTRKAANWLNAGGWMNEPEQGTDDRQDRRMSAAEFAQRRGEAIDSGEWYDAD